MDRGSGLEKKSRRDLVHFQEFVRDSYILAGFPNARNFYYMPDIGRRRIRNRIYLDFAIIFGISAGQLVLQ